MKKFILTSPKFTGQIVFAYNELDILISYINEADMSEQALRWQLANLPLDINGLQMLQKRIHGKIEEVPADISFDAFWNAYGHKVNRKRAELLFKKLKDTDKLMCIMAIKPYLKYCQATGRGIADPEKYLSKAYFETDWRGLK